MSILKYGVTFELSVRSAEEYVFYGQIMAVVRGEQTVTAKDMTLTRGDTAKIDAATSGDGALTYQVTEGDAVTVSETGLVTAVAAGTATIRIDAEGTENYEPAYTTIEVKVVEVTPTPTKAADPSATPTPSKAAEPTVTPTPQSAKPTSTAAPTEPAGSDKVMLSLDKTNAEIVCGNKQTLKATLTGSDAKISWKSSNAKIASVDAGGKIAAKQAGQVTITASAAGKSASCTIQVLFKDVINSKDFWYKPTYDLVNKDIVKGYDKQTNFKPANECSRAQMVTFLWRLAGEPEPSAKTTSFKDIKTKDYFYKPVLWAVEKGITTGVSKTKFDPQGICTRAQTVTFLWRMAGKPEPKAKTSKFKDVKSKDYFYKATIWASEKSIVAGYSDGTFKPQGKCLRRQMVTFLYKYNNNVGVKK